MTDQPVRRELKHRRTIHSDGYLREDGLWEVEATMKDIKTYDVHRDFDGTLVTTGEPFHDISISIQLDDSFMIQDINVSIDAHPFPNCGQAAPNFASIKGTRIGPGWHSALKKQFKGVSGCTHVLELLPVVATTAFQMMWQPLGQKYPHLVANSLSGLVNTCKGWSEDGPMVTRLIEAGVLTAEHLNNK